MARKFNLLPPELARTKGIGKVARVLNIFAVASSVLFLVLGVAAALTLFLLSDRLKTLSERKESLKVSISSMNSTEQQLLLVKDRIQKIDKLFAKRDIESQLGKHLSVVGELPEGLSFDENTLTLGKSELKLNAVSSVGMSDLFASLVQRSDLVLLILEEISFSPYLGYRIVLGVL